MSSTKRTLNALNATSRLSQVLNMAMPYHKFVEFCFTWIKWHCSLIWQLLFIGTGAESVTPSSLNPDPEWRNSLKGPIAVRADAVLCQKHIILIYVNVFCLQF